MSNDCSERICPFGLAHVDTPKGDLDASGGVLSGPDSVVVPNNDVYPYGTTEQFPAMENSRGVALSNTAHYYMECSNKGLCDKTSGTCACLPGYEGSACQRASCPSSGGAVCSGHGTCVTIQELATSDNNNYYELWDKDASMACECDPGYTAADCSQRECVYGYDPLYADDGYASVRYSNWTYVIYSQTSGATYTGNYSITFYDVFGEDWHTDPIDISATCTEVVAALEALPNDVIHENSVLCFSDTTYGTSEGYGTIYDADVHIKARFVLAFPDNAGKLKPIEINTYLDGVRPTLFTNEADSTLGTYVYANGFTGEFNDYVPDLCAGVQPILKQVGQYWTLDGLTDQQIKLLKKCLGDADGNTAQAHQSEVYNWDYGDTTNPHLIKLVDTTALPVTRLCNSVSGYSYRNRITDATTGLTTCYRPSPPGFYATLIYGSGVFKIFNNVGKDYSASTTFNVFTTTGTLQVVSSTVGAFSVVSGEPSSDKIPRYHSKTLYLTGQIDCESVSTSPCINKEDLVMIFNSQNTLVKANPSYLNIYTVKKISTENTDSSTFSNQLVLDTGLNWLYSSGDIAAVTSSVQASKIARVYKFTPPVGVEYAAPCSTRGICDTNTGTCQCFNGHTGADCSVQDALAK